jgi:hypothetical protein
MCNKKSRNQDSLVIQYFSNLDAPNGFMNLVKPIASTLNNLKMCLHSNKGVEIFLYS